MLFICFHGAGFQRTGTLFWQQNSPFWPLLARCSFVFWPFVYSFPWCRLRIYLILYEVYFYLTRMYFESFFLYGWFIRFPCCTFPVYECFSCPSVPSSVSFLLLFWPLVYSLSNLAGFRARARQSWEKQTSWGFAFQIERLSGPSGISRASAS